VLDQIISYDSLASIRDARWLAAQLGHKRMGIAHVLYGLSNAKQQVAVDLMAAAGMHSYNIYDAILQAFGRSSSLDYQSIAECSSIRHICTEADTVRKIYEHSEVTPVHLLLAITQTDSDAYQVFKILNTDIQNLRLASIDALLAMPPQGQTLA
jgi:ATP-dependent Clp protease ATP-binding subunit ClpA